MCRLLGFRSNTPIPLAYPLLDAENALVKQSKKDSRGWSHPDGWGIGYYQNGKAIVRKNVLPAYEDIAFREQARHLLANTAIIHVRAASIGTVALHNNHPFRHQNWLWAHNGTVRPFEEVHERLQSRIDPAFLRLRQGETDSELCFLLFLTELAKQAPADLNRPEPGIALASLRRTAQIIVEITKPYVTPKPTALTFLTTNGEMLLAFRLVATLFLLRPKKPTWFGPPQFSFDAKSGKNSFPNPKKFRAMIFASEPLTAEAWEEIPNGQCGLVKPNWELEFADFGVRSNSAKQ